MEGENRNMLPFIENLVEKTSTSFVINVYERPTLALLYLSLDSFALKSEKINLIKTLNWITMTRKSGEHLRTTYTEQLFWPY